MNPLARLPIRARLTLWQVLAFSVIFGALVGLLLVSQRNTLRDTTRESLELTSRVMVDQITEKHTPLDALLGQQVVPGEGGKPEVIGQIVRDGRVLESSAPAARTLLDPVAVTAALADGHWHGQVRLPGRAADDMLVAVRIDHGEHAGDVLVLAQTLKLVEDAVRRSEVLALAAAPVALLLAVLGGWVIAGTALRGVDELTRRAALVDASEPHQPLPVPVADDEVSRLARTLNAMLERLSLALERERRMAADASHELRTPIGVMETELDVALRSPDLPAPARPVLASVKAEVSSLGRIVANLLLLARADATGEVALETREDDLLALAYSVAGRLAGRAAELGVELGVEGTPTVVLGDPELLRQAIANLVDNALVQTRSGGTVRVEVDSADGPRLTVIDTGVGIPEAELSRVFDRFYRVDPARRRERGGAGLGLEITRRIVEAHGGAVSVSSVEGVGSRFTISLPAMVSP